MPAEREHRGEVVDWNDARGFGFISEGGIQGRTFFHIKDVDGSIRPAVRDIVSYTIARRVDERLAARRVRIIAASPRVADDASERQNAPMRVTVRIVGAMCLATAVLFCVVTDRAPAWLALCYVLGGVISFVMYRIDKRAAVAGNWRVSEGTLHLLDLAFGIGGGLLAQGVFRHKSSKVAFGVVSAMILALHIIGLALLLAGVLSVDALLRLIA